MKRSVCSEPEDFSVSPLLALLPRKGNAGKLALLTSSLYARYEKVSGLRRDLGDAAEKNTVKKLLAEEGMLRQVLEWLEVKI